MRILGWTFFIFFAIIIGLYPLVYFLTDMGDGFLHGKSPELLQSVFWTAAFYMHIFFGASAMLIGWSQFSKKIRNRFLNTHRLLGKIYVASVIISGVTGFYIALFANGGIVASLGFVGLALTWLYTTVKAFQSIRGKDIEKHEEWMIRSYAITFAAVTLRIWIPLSQIARIDFVEAYRVIAWLCWIPNLLVAELMIVRKRKLKFA
jgi:uncharacterized membrane protein